MSLSFAEKMALQDTLAKHCDAVKKAFKPGAKVTLVVRNPAYGDEAGVVIGDDDLDEAVAEIRRRQAADGERKRKIEELTAGDRRCAVCGTLMAHYRLRGYVCPHGHSQEAKS